MPRRNPAGPVALLLLAVALVIVGLLWLTKPDPGSAAPVRADVPGAAEHLSSEPVAPIAPGPGTPTDDPRPLEARPATLESPAPPPRPTSLREGAEVVSLSGRVLDAAGAPVAGAELRFGWHGNDERLRERAWADAIEASYRRPPASGVWSDGDGRFTLFLDAAHMRTQSRAQGFVVALAEGHAALVHRTPELRIDAVDLGELRLAPGTWLTARTVDPAGEPLPGVTVSFDVLRPARAEDVRSGVRLSPQQDDFQFDELLRPALQSVSDDMGRVRLPFLPEGTARLRFARDDLVSVTLPDVSLTLPGPVVLDDVVLDPGGTIAGTLRYADGSPVAGGFAAVILRDDGNGRDAEALRQERARAEHEARRASEAGGLAAGASAAAGSTGSTGSTGSAGGAGGAGSVASAGSAGGGADHAPGSTTAGHGAPLRTGLLKSKTTTDDQGRFAISGLADGWYELSVTAEHHAWTHRAGVPTSSTDLELLLPEPGTLQLDVRDAETGEPVPVPVVEVTLPAGYEHLQGGIRWRHDISVDPQTPGLVSVVGIGLEGARLKVGAPRYGPYTGDVPAVPPGAFVTLEVRLRAALRLAGVIIDERDEPLPDVEVTLRSALDRRGHRTVSDREGRFVIDDLSPGGYEIDARAPGLLESLREPLELHASRDDFVIRLYRETSVGGLVLDRDGTPTPGVTVIALPLWDVPAFTDLPPEPGVDLRSHVPSRLPNTVSGEDGRYLLARMLPGEYALFATHDSSLPSDLSRERWNAKPTVAPTHALRRPLSGGQEAAQDLVLPVTTSVFGVVRAGEHPVVGASVMLYVPIEGQSGWRRAAETTSDDDGRYELLDLQPGVCAVIVQARAGAFPVTRRLELLAAVETRHDVTIDGGIVRGTVVEASSRLPAPGVTVDAFADIADDAAWLGATGFTREDLRLMNPRPGVDSASTITDAQGRFELTSLPPGPVAVQTQGGGTLRSQAPWTTLTEREPLELTLEVVRAARIEGTLTHRGGGAVDPNAVYLVLREPVEDRHMGYGDLADGHWSFEDLQGGRYELQVLDYDDSVLLRETVNVTLGATEHVELLLDD